MTLEELQKHRIYSHLNDPVKNFIVEYIRSGFRIEAAVRVAWPNVTNEKTIQTVGARALRNKHVADLLDLWHGEEPEPTDDEFRRYVWKAIHENKNGQGKSALLSLYAELRGLRGKGKSLDLLSAEDDEILKDIKI